MQRIAFPRQETNMPLQLLKPVLTWQASAHPDTSMKDRLKMAGGDVIGGVADTVDSPIVSVAANVAKVSQFLQCTKLIL